VEKSERIKTERINRLHKWIGDLEIRLTQKEAEIRKLKEEQRVLKIELEDMKAQNKIFKFLSKGTQPVCKKEEV